MKLKMFALGTLLLGQSLAAQAMSSDDPLVVYWGADKLESGRTDDSQDFSRLEFNTWAGYDYSKLGLDLELEAFDNEVKHGSVTLFYQSPISPFWDVRFGGEHQFQSEEDNALMVGFVGTLPGFISTDARFHFKDESDFGIKIETEYEYRLNQKWVLVPQANLKWKNEKTEEEAYSEFSLRLDLEYLIDRQTSPYIGVEWVNARSKVLGNDQQVRLLIGFRFWQ